MIKEYNEIANIFVFGKFVCTSGMSLNVKIYKSILILSEFDVDAQVRKVYGELKKNLTLKI